MVGRGLRGYLILLAVFALGAVAGGASVFSVIKHRYTALLLDERVDERRLEALIEQLTLDEPQRERIAGILNDARREARVISLQTDARCGHPLLDHRAKVDDRIRAELQVAQRAKFDALLARRREREATTPGPAAP
jgi:Spy/CpxP family protein refolding chaperone